MDAKEVRLSGRVVRIERSPEKRRYPLASDQLHAGSGKRRKVGAEKIVFLRSRESQAISVTNKRLSALLKHISP